MFEKLIKKFTNDHQEIPLFYVTFDLEKGFCDLKLHPSLRDDKFIIDQLNGLVDHIRNNYDMEDLTKLTRKLTNDLQEIPLFYVTFDLKKYLEVGEKGSCDLKLHTSLRDDQSIIDQLNGLVDYIRNNYDMEDLTK